MRLSVSTLLLLILLFTKVSAFSVGILAAGLRNFNKVCMHRVEEQQLFLQRHELTEDVAVVRDR